MKVLANILRPERFRQRVASSTVGTLSGHNMTVPALSELKADRDIEPLLVTNMRRTFVLTRCSSTGIARYGFSEVPIDEEDSILSELYVNLLTIGAQKHWDNRCKTALEGVEGMRVRGLEPKFLILSKADIVGSDGESNDLERLAMVQGHVADLEGVQVLLADLPKGAAMVTAAPSLLGVYTRVGDHLGVLIQNADSTIRVVAP